jgi:hypothetical protein
MRSEIAIWAAVASLVLLAQPVAAQDARSEFDNACTANPGFFSFAVAGLEQDPDGLARLCGCLATEFEDLEDADIAMLVKDLDGSATAEDRAAYGDYTALELKAREGLDTCLVREGFADGVDPAGDRANFNAACTGSEGLLMVIGGEPEAAAAARDKLCACLDVALAPQISTADADILGQDLDGTATQESRAAYPTYAEIETKAGAAFDTCFADAMPQ